MSLIERDDYDALARAARQVSVYERLPEEEQTNGPTQPGRGCFGCDHSVGPMSSDKKYSSIFFYPYESAHSYDSLTHFYLGYTPTPRFSIVVSPEDKFYTNGYQFLNDRFQNWDPPTNTLTSILNLNLEDSSDLYVRQLCAYDSFGESTGVRHINGRVNIEEDFVDGLNDEHPGQFIVIATSSYIRGTYVDLECEFGADVDEAVSPAGLYDYGDMFMTDAAWKRISELTNMSRRGRGPQLTKLDNGEEKIKKKKSWAHPDLPVFSGEPVDINFSLEPETVAQTHDYTAISVNTATAAAENWLINTGDSPIIEEDA